MEAEDIVDPWFLQHTGFNHRLCPSSSLCGFLGWLKEELHGALQVGSMFGEDSGCPKKHSDVAVMSACVHDPFGLGRELLASKLLKGEGVHVSAEGHRITGSTSFKDPHHSCSSDPGLHKYAVVSQLTCDQSGGFPLTEGEFRVGVNLSPDSDEVVFQLRRLIQETNRRGESDVLSF